jgi:hypothetical protein
MASNDGMSSERWNENVVVAEFEILQLHLTGGTEEIRNKISMPCHRPEIWTTDILKPNQER